jgi:hypothetical protein
MFATNLRLLYVLTYRAFAICAVLEVWIDKTTVTSLTDTVAYRVAASDWRKTYILNFDGRAYRLTRRCGLYHRRGITDL